MAGNASAVAADYRRHQRTNCYELTVRDTNTSVENASATAKALASIVNGDRPAARADSPSPTAWTGAFPTPKY
jgi:hypothetical protein